MLFSSAHANRYFSHCTLVANPSNQDDRPASSPAVINIHQVNLTPAIRRATIPRCLSTEDEIVPNPIWHLSRSPAGKGSSLLIKHVVRGTSVLHGFTTMSCLTDQWLTLLRNAGEPIDQLLGEDYQSLPPNSWPNSSFA